MSNEKFYCINCGLIQPLGVGFITCSGCGHPGLRGFAKLPRKVTCPHDDCCWVGWDDGGVNDDLGRHLRKEHPEVAK